VGYVILIVVVLAVVIIAATVTRRRGSARGVTYATSIEAVDDKMVIVRGAPVLSPEGSTEEIVHREFVADTADDLLDPHNPHHAQWVRDHPDVESDDEYLADHPEDGSTPPPS
jgi:hypothetical protein